MRSLGVMVVAGAVLAVGSTGWADDDHAQPRGGGSGGSSSVGSSHHSGGSGSGSSSSSSGSSSSSSGSSYRDSSRDSSRDSGSSSSYRSSSTGAQQRHPRAGTGTGWRYGHGRGGYFYSPYWGGYSGYYGLGYGWGYGWSPYYNSGWYGYNPYSGYGGYGYGSGYGYGHRYGYAGEGSVRVLVEPKDARVYVDGYYAGVVDDFDGLFQRLRIAPGRHEIALKLDGYRSQTFKVYVPYDDTLKLHYKMVQGAGDDVSQVIGRPEDEARDQARYAQREREARADDGEDDDDAGDAGDRESDQRGERGVVRLDVRPADASVYVDGAFRGTGRELRQLRLTPGRHHLEVVRPGYRTIDREIDVRSGEDSAVDIDLDRS